MYAFFLFIMIMGTMVWILGWSNSIKENQRQFAAERESYKVSNNYKPIDRRFINKNSDSITILQYKLQNAEYREKLMLLGLWYFGLSDIWKMKPEDVSPEKLANVVNDKMPWVVENSSIKNIDDLSLSRYDFNHNVHSERYGESIFNVSHSVNNPNDIINSINNIIDKHNFEIDYYNDRRQPDSFLNNDRSEYFSDYDTGESPEIELKDYNTYDSFEQPQEPSDIHIEPNQNFFPFQ